MADAQRLDELVGIKEAEALHRGLAAAFVQHPGHPKVALRPVLDKLVAGYATWTRNKRKSSVLWPQLIKRAFDDLPQGCELLQRLLTGSFEADGTFKACHSVSILTPCTLVVLQRVLVPDEPPPSSS